MAKNPNKKSKAPSKAKRPVHEESRVMAILKKEYAFENWLLAILAPVIILYGVYIVLGKFGTLDLASALGNSGIGIIDFFFLTKLRRILTGVFLILIGTLVLIYLLIPYLQPSFIEMKKVTWPDAKTLASSSTRVFLFLIILAIFFVLLSFAYDPLFNWLYSL